MSTRRHATLAADLRARDDAALATLLRARPDLLSPVPSDVSSLAARATTRASVQRALDVLDRFTLQVLEALCVLPEPAEVSDVAATLGTDPGTALERLRDLALVYDDGDGGVLVPRAVAEVIGSPAGLGPPVGELLTRLGPRRLEQLTADLGGPPAKVLTDPERLDALIDRAAPAAREALDSLAWGPPTGRLPGALRDVDAGTAKTPVDWLLAHGLLVALDTQTAVLPREVALRLRGGRVHRTVEASEPEPVVTVADPARVERTAAGAAATVVRLVEDLLELWSATPPRVLRAGGVGVRERTRAAAALDVEESTLTLLVETAYAAGLVAPGEQDLDEAWLPTPTYDTWLDEPTAQRWRRLVTAWRDTPRVAGLAGTADSRGKAVNPLGPELHRTVAPAVRREVLADLAALPPDAATAAESVVARLSWRRPLRAGRLLTDLVGWTLREAEVLGVAAGGALGPPGRHLAAGDDDAAAEALAAALPPLVDHVLLQGDLTAIGPGPLQPDLARRLRLVADVESTGGATVYRFTEASVRRAFDAGWTGGELAEFLASASRTPVPQALGYLVDDVARRHGRLRVGAAGSYVRCDDEATLHELLTDKRSASLRLRRLAPTVVAAQAAPDVVLERLREMGYAPAAESESGDVLLARAEVRRARVQRPPAGVVSSPPEPSAALLGAAVAAIRAGDRAAERAPDGWSGAAGGQLARPTADVLAILAEAAAEGRSVWMGYVDAEGRGTQRVVEPVAVEAGYVSAYDHLRGDMRTFAVHRITGVALLDEETDSALHGG